jgi:spore photoproduct lyase
MFDFIYIEEAVLQYARTREILARFPNATHIPCQRYGEVFNRKAQDFRLQKQKPALILARKHGNLLLEAPPGYGIGSQRNFYFSHMLNCLYDCRYCFLQGMYRSAHMVVFVNFEDFQDALAKEIVQANDDTPYFFTGYDCDSLALESITNFVASFMDFFAAHPQAFFELRTKSVNIKPLLHHPPLPNCIAAFSMTPSDIAKVLEVGVPPVDSRLDAMAKLQTLGWPVGLRFDPLIYQSNYRDHYRALFAAVFARLDPDQLHSVSLGQFRLPRQIYKTMYQLMPDEKLLAYGLDEKAGMVSYKSDLALEMHTFCSEELLRYISPQIFFPCPSTTLESPS